MFVTHFKSTFPFSCFLFIVNQRTITSDLNDLHTTIQDIRTACQKMPATAEDRFAVVMSVSFKKNARERPGPHGICRLIRCKANSLEPVCVPWLHCVQNFLENSHPAIQSLESLQQRAMEEFSKTASYFGEDGKATNTESFFGIFSEFMHKFEVSKKHSFLTTYACLQLPLSP